MLDRLLKNLAVEPEPFALCMLDIGWRICLPAPPAVVFHFVLQGRGTVRDPKGVCGKVAPMSVSVVPAGMAHELEADGEVVHELRIDAPPSDPGICEIVAGTSDDHDLVVACGKVSARYGEAIGLFDHLHDILTVDLSDVPHVEMLFQEILAEQSKNDPGSMVIIQSLMMQVIVHVFRHVEYDSSGSLPWLSALEDERLARAIDLVLDSPGENHSVESLADSAHMSRSAFAEHFTAAFSRSPMNFVNHVRMERAARLLLDSSSSVDQISGAVGFSSRSHFSQAFKKHTGQSPAEYRVN